MRRAPIAGACALLLIAAATSGAAASESLLTPLASGTELPASPWRRAGLPDQRMAATRYALVELDGRRVLRVEAEDSYGNLVHPLRQTGPSLRLAWQWRLDRPLAAADLRTKAGDDSALKVCAFFDQPLEDMPWAERMLMRFARSQSAEPLPAATLCYVWDGALPVDSTLDNAYTRRVRYLVLRNVSNGLRKWLPERRDLAADFRRLFGAESARMPPLVGVAIGADADNTHGDSLGFVADLTLEP